MDTIDKVILKAGYKGEDKFRQAVAVFLRLRSREKGLQKHRPTREFTNAINSMKGIASSQSKRVMNWYGHLLAQFSIRYDLETGFHQYPGNPGGALPLADGDINADEPFRFFIRHYGRDKSLPERLQIRFRTINQAKDAARHAAQFSGVTVCIERVT
jgi:hypothetical protein